MSDVAKGGSWYISNESAEIAAMILGLGPGGAAADASGLSVSVPAMGGSLLVVAPGGIDAARCVDV